jgi:hypothetical protein
MKAKLSLFAVDMPGLISCKISENFEKIVTAAYTKGAAYRWKAKTKLIQTKLQMSYSN